ncbi:MAG: hypothetical protein ABR978_09810 [Dehalococcoidia bacterium]
MLMSVLGLVALLLESLAFLESGAERLVVGGCQAVQVLRQPIDLLLNPRDILPAGGRGFMAPPP